MLSHDIITHERAGTLSAWRCCLLVLLDLFKFFEAGGSVARVVWLEMGVWVHALERPSLTEEFLPCLKLALSDLRVLR